jgi:hypothetical protein
MRKTKLSLHYEPPQEKHLPPFKHRNLRLLTTDQKETFQKRLESLVLEFDARTRINMVMPKHEDTKRALIALEKHLNAICEIVCAGSVDDSETALAAVIYDWDSKTLERIITDFPMTVATMRELVKTSLEYRTFKVKLPATFNPHGVVLKAAFLLYDYKIKRTVTTTGCWAAVTRYILLHGCGRNETDANLRNLLARVKSFFTQKKELK